MRKFNYDVIRKEIQESSKDSSIYIGADSKLVAGKTVFALVVVIHIDNSKGCKVWSQKTTEPRRMQIAERLLKEVELSVNCAMKLLDVIGDHNFEIHLDLNPSAEHKSNKVLHSAVGYVKGVGVPYKIKPEAVAASYAADVCLN